MATGTCKVWSESVFGIPGSEGLGSFVGGLGGAKNSPVRLKLGCLYVCGGGGVEGSGSELSMFCDLKRARTYTQTGHSVPGDERRGDSQDRGVKKSKLELASRSRPRIDRDSKFGVYGTPRKKHALNVVFELTCGLILQFTLPTERRVSMVLWGGHRVCA